jgi:hypothetical protein
MPERAVAEMAMPPYLRANDPMARWRMKRGSRRSSGRVMVVCDAVASACELTGVETVKAAPVLRVEAE